MTKNHMNAASLLGIEGADPLGNSALLTIGLPIDKVGAERWG